jgi:hypothetical protein
MELIRELGLRSVGSQGYRKSWGLYLCACGKEFEVVIASVKTRRTVSCGCSRGEAHGLSSTDEYRIYKGIKARCYNKNNHAYKHYGGRGIKVSEEWLASYKSFIDDMGKRPSREHSVDRINNDGNYSALNCRWATAKEQANNTRINVVLSAYGISMTINEWAETLEVPIRRLTSRMQRGWSTHDTLFLTKRVNQYNNGNTPITGE